MKVLGSLPSPFARRIRLYLDGVEHEFAELNVLGPEGRREMKRISPVMKVPVLVDGDTTIMDSRQIYNYLTEKLGREKLDWDGQNTLTLIDGANDSFVILLLLKRSEVEDAEKRVIGKLQRERIELTMDALEQMCAEGKFDQWDYRSISLFCMLDWIEFRELYRVEDKPALHAFWQRNKTRPGVELTDPR
ncbi:glutathione S-transferase family protein [Pseudomaricurvus alkylphenolicus]|uniref:glutathione S-transferase family protein n=1 Tax=Pseudomaricurvus alkylphenolicus TaxID=1306991 RepID=UPI0014206597|nr:glutathione S-transferase family protein [Pseudomaricurvus alkylphenolicus]NIB44211.1 glutathione S-transferase family protein [Pseudomaricurvus alkylphenolicus]